MFRGGGYPSPRYGLITLLFLSILAGLMQVVQANRTDNPQDFIILVLDGDGQDLVF
jgi:hypothetical protein